MIITIEFKTEAIVKKYIVDVVFDVNGNVYLLFNKELYDFNINSKNILSLEKSNLSKDELAELFKMSHKINKMDLNLHYKSGSLKNKIIRDSLTKLSDVVDEESEDDDDESDANKKIEENYNSYYYEDILYETKTDASDDPTSNTGEGVQFMGTDDVKIICYDDEVPIYNVILFNNSIEFGDPFFKTQLIGIEPIYRIKIYQSGNIVFRPIGCPETTYKIAIDKDILVINDTKSIK